MDLFALILGVLTIAGLIRLWRNSLLPGGEDPQMAIRYLGVS
jgi:hypothetical protein